MGGEFKIKLHRKFGTYPVSLRQILKNHVCSQQESTGVSDDDFVSYVTKWHEAGASLIGGCCRTTPNTIRAIYKAFN